MSALRSQKQPKAQQPVYAQRKKKDYSREAHSGSQEGKAPGKDRGRNGERTRERGERVLRFPRREEAVRRLQHLGGSEQRLGCASGKLSSSSDSSSEISDSCPSEGKQ
ncbi:hypothetical protein KUCAC02_036265 [Chaenocephalus aceratus]|nr:hypothetical protein KUCAC02_036265 [Chaenocephalus aceratus]